MNVIALGRDVGDADVGVGGRGGEELHDADGAGLAARALVELRFLVALGADHQPVEAVPVTVFLKQHDKVRSEEHTSELQSLMRISYAVFCLNKKNTHTNST